MARISCFLVLWLYLDIEYRHHCIWCMHACFLCNLHAADLSLLYFLSASDRRLAGRYLALNLMHTHSCLLLWLSWYRHHCTCAWEFSFEHMKWTIHTFTLLFFFFFSLQTRQGFIRRFVPPSVDPFHLHSCFKDKQYASEKLTLL